MSKHKQHYKREWLNPKHGRAFVITRAAVVNEFATASLTIGDCGQDICLDFDAEDEASVKKRLHKLDALRKHLDVIEETLIEAYMRMPTKKEWKQINKARKEYYGDELPHYHL